jgi:hypothetical protein
MTSESPDVVEFSVVVPKSTDGQKKEFETLIAGLDEKEKMNVVRELLDGIFEGGKAGTVALIDPDTDSTDYVIRSAGPAITHLEVEPEAAA